MIVRPKPNVLGILFSLKGSIAKRIAWRSLLVTLFTFWWAMTTPGLLPNVMFDNDRQAAFFFGEPLKVLARIWVWFVTEADIYREPAAQI